MLVSIYGSSYFIIPCDSWVALWLTRGINIIKLYILKKIGSNSSRVEGELTGTSIVFHVPQAIMQSSSLTWKSHMCAQCFLSMWCISSYYAILILSQMTLHTMLPIALPTQVPCSMNSSLKP